VAKNTWKLISVKAQLRKKLKFLKATIEYIPIHAIDNKYKQNGVLSVTVILIPNSGMHRSLFHPLATVRHRIWAGPEKEKQIGNIFLKTLTNTHCRYVTKKKHQITFIYSSCLLSPTFELNQQFLLRSVVHFKILITEANNCVQLSSSQLYVLKWTTQWNRKHSVISQPMQGIKNSARNATSSFWSLQNEIVGKNEKSKTSSKSELKFTALWRSSVQFGNRRIPKKCKILHSIGWRRISFKCVYLCALQLFVLKCRTHWN